jgi:hypothetical protein
MDIKPQQTPKRIDSTYIIHELEHILHLERGIFFTVRKLLSVPGQIINEFLFEDRTKIIKPVLFVVITSLIQNFANKFAHFHDASIEKVVNDNAVIIIQNWCNSNLGYYNLCLGFFVALFLKIVFFKSKYNFYEVLILMCYIIGVDMLLAAVTGLFSILLHFDFMKTYAFVCFIYTSWAIANFYGKDKWYNYIKAFVAFVLGLILLTFFPNIMGSIINLVIK